MSATRIISFVDEALNVFVVVDGSIEDPGTGQDGLYLIDPATSTTTLVSSIEPGIRATDYPNHNLFALLPGGRTVFSARGPDGADEPWITDGTAAGTHEIADINPGGSFEVDGPLGTHVTSTILGSLAQDFVTLNGTQVLFKAGDAAHGRELWVTDGTAAGTALVSDLYPGPDGSSPFGITALGNGRALFSAGDPVNGTGLWETDGTALGTSRVGSFVIDGSVALGDGTALFTGSDGADVGLWRTDGTAADTYKVASLPGLYGDLIRLGDGRVVFDNNGQVWITDGTPAGTQALSPSVEVPSDNVDSGFGLLGDGRAEFMVAQAGYREQLWITDGTSAGTFLVKDFGPFNGYYDYAGSAPGFTSLADGRVIFTAYTAGPSRVTDGFTFGSIQYSVWSSDGTVAGTQPLAVPQLPGGLLPSSEYGGLQGAGLVDAPFYDAHYPDVANAGLAAATHYHLTGWHEGRDPDALFSTQAYLATYKDVAAADIDPLQHYDTSGWREGRDPSASFDTNLYLKLNPDVAAANIDPLQHYQAFGQAEGRRVLPVIDGAHIADGLFDPTYYLLANPDVAAAGVDALTHYLHYGTDPGRNPDSFFDTSYYLAHNPDVAASGINPMLDYEEYGWKAGRDPSASFSTNGYLAANPDVKAAGIDPLQHFLQNGAAEGRLPLGIYTPSATS